MRTIKGFVCVAVMETGTVDRQILFGPSINKAMLGKEYESMTTNHLVPFTTFKEAELARIKLGKRKYRHNHQQSFKEIWIGYLKMEMAESDQENRDPFFEDSDSLVVIVQFETGWQLVGKGKLIFDEISLCPRLGADLYDNGFTPFRDIETALFVQNDSQRQTWTPCRLATFSLERITD